MNEAYPAETMPRHTLEEPDVEGTCTIRLQPTDLLRESSPVVHYINEVPYKVIREGTSEKGPLSDEAGKTYTNLHSILRQLPPFQEAAITVEKRKGQKPITSIHVRYEGGEK